MFILTYIVDNGVGKFAAGTSSKQKVSLAMLMTHLQTVVNSKKSKNIEIFSLFEEVFQFHLRRTVFNIIVSFLFLP